MSISAASYPAHWQPKNTPIWVWVTIGSFPKQFWRLATAVGNGGEAVQRQKLCSMKIYQSAGWNSLLLPLPLLPSTLQCPSSCIYLCWQLLFENDFCFMLSKMLISTIFPATIDQSFGQPIQLYSAGKYSRRNTRCILKDSEKSWFPLNQECS